MMTTQKQLSKYHGVLVAMVENEMVRLRDNGKTIDEIAVILTRAGELVPPTRNLVIATLARCDSQAKYTIEDIQAIELARKAAKVAEMARKKAARIRKEKEAGRLS